ncbi:MAG TPA: hypothetical protein VFD32_23220 [Dehalococcoidia bacterium]|nr:hypothetical protein [Dehalococcoidia bacterium]
MIRLLGGGRLALGLLIVGAPRLAVRLFGVPRAGDTPDGRFVTRIAGNRDAVLGAALLLAPRRQRAAVVAACTAVDAADLLVTLGSARGLGRRTVLANVIAAGSAAAGGLWALDRLRAADRGGSSPSDNRG